MNILLFLAQLFPAPTNLPQSSADGSQIQNILNIVFTTIGAISVLIIAIAGFTYVISGGDPKRTAQAKDAIMYAVIGVAVSISAFVILNFVLKRIFG